MRTEKVKNVLEVIGCVAVLALMLVVCWTTAGSQSAQTEEQRSEEVAPVGEVYTVNSREAYGVTEAEEATIRDYLSTYFNALAQLEDANVIGYYKSDDSTAALSSQIDQTALEFLIDVRRLQPTDLTMTAWRCGITYVSRSVDEEGLVTIEFLENNVQDFVCLQGESAESAGIAHTMIVDESNGEVQLVSHLRDEDGYLLVSDAYDALENKTTPEADLDAIQTELLENAQADVEALNAARDSFENRESVKTAAQTYDREAAVAYANEWVDDDSIIRNDAWGLYDIYGGNCNNFISQCLYAGDIPMDLTGTQWKWYSDDLNNNGGAYGRTSSWTGVDDFFTYAQENTGTGLVADTTLNTYAGEIGDVLQYGTENEWHHSVIITGLIYDDDGNVIDYLINSNTTDRENYPASAYAYSNLRLIKVIGYN